MISVNSIFATEHTERRTRFAQLCLLLSFLCVLCGKSSAQEFKTVHPGIEYAHVDHKIGNDPVKINLLRLDLKKVRLDVYHAFDKAIGVKPTSEIAKDHNAVAAINGGFFRLDKSEFAGDAAGTLMIDGALLSESLNDRINLALTNARGETRVEIGHFTTIPSFAFFGATVPIKISGINREAKTGDVILYSPRFGATTPKREVAAELIVSNCKDKKLAVDGHGYRCRFVELRKESGNTIPPQGFVISLSVDATEELAEFNKQSAGAVAGTKVYIQFLLKDRKLGTVLLAQPSVDITNGVSRLIKQGQIEITWEQEKASKSFAETRHPRTAVAKLKDGKFLMITVDGRQPGVSVGMTLQELADYILSLGANDAMNLDGGGSTTMYLDGKVVNTPSEKGEERRVSDAIIVTLRTKN